MINKYGKGDVVPVSTVFGPPYHDACPKVSETGLFRHLFKNVFRVRNFGNRSAMSFILFFKMFKISFRFQNIRKKLIIFFFVYQIIASELGVLNCLY